MLSFVKNASSVNNANGALLAIFSIVISALQLYVMNANFIAPVFHKFMIVPSVIVLVVTALLKQLRGKRVISIAILGFIVTITSVYASSAAVSKFNIVFTDHFSNIKMMCKDGVCPEKIEKWTIVQENPVLLVNYSRYFLYTMKSSYILSGDLKSFELHGKAGNFKISSRYSSTTRTP